MRGAALPTWTNQRLRFWPRGTWDQWSATRRGNNWLLPYVKSKTRCSNGNLVHGWDPRLDFLKIKFWLYYQSTGSLNTPTGLGHKGMFTPEWHDLVQYSTAIYWLRSYSGTVSESGTETQYKPSTQLFWKCEACLILKFLIPKTNL